MDRSLEQVVLMTFFIKYKVYVEVGSIALINKMSKYYVSFLGFMGNICTILKIKSYMFYINTNNLSFVNE